MSIRNRMVWVKNVKWNHNTFHSFDITYEFLHHFEHNWIGWSFTPAARRRKHIKSIQFISALDRISFKHWTQCKFCYSKIISFSPWNFQARTIIHASGSFEDKRTRWKKESKTNCDEMAWETIRMKHNSGWNEETGLYTVPGWVNVHNCIYENGEVWMQSVTI